MEAISNAGAAIGILSKDGVVLIAEKKITSKVQQGLHASGSLDCGQDDCGPHHCTFPVCSFWTPMRWA